MNIGTRHRKAMMTVSAIMAIVSPRAVAADAAKGMEVYKSHQCAMCHKVNGAGGKKGPDLSAGSEHDRPWLEKYLMNPKSMLPKGTMPPAKVTTAELHDLIDYLESLKK